MSGSVPGSVMAGPPRLRHFAFHILDVGLKDGFNLLLEGFVCS
jgi:hypothetical protein